MDTETTTEATVTDTKTAEPDTEAPAKTKDELNSDYIKLATVAGDKGWVIQALKAELDQIHMEMYKLKQEFKRINDGGAA